MEARRQKRRYKEIAETVLSTQMNTDLLQGNIKALAQGPSKNELVSIKDLMVISQINKAIHGDTKAFEVIRDIIGENPKENLREPRTYRIQMQCRECGKIISKAVDVRDAPLS